MKQMKRGQSVWLWIGSVVLLVIGVSSCNFWNASPPSAYPPSWAAHEYEVLDVVPTRRAAIRRNRLHVRIFAPTAITPEDRIATGMDAALHFYTVGRGEFKFISVSLWATPSLHRYLYATVDYAPDGCGVSGSGDDCTGLIWTNLRAADGQVTKEQVEFREAWDFYKEDFKERIEFGEASHEQIDEDRLIEFLAERFDTTPDHISDEMMAASRAVFPLKEIDLPSHE